MGPFNIPWLTFAAFLVTAASTVLAFGWVVWDRNRENRKGRRQ